MFFKKTGNMTQVPSAVMHFIELTTLPNKETLQPATVCCPPVDTVATQYHIGSPGVSSLSPEDQIYPSFSGYSSME